MTEQSDVDWKRAVNTGPEGDFSYTFKDPVVSFHIMIEAPGFTSRAFRFMYTPVSRSRGHWIGPSGIIAEPLKVGPGVEVTGRLLQEGKPLAGVLMGLKYCDRFDDPTVKRSNTKTDDQGNFRFPYVLADTEYSAYAELGILKDHGTVNPRRFRSGVDGSATDLGDLEARPGLTLAGKVVFSDGSAPSKDYALMVSPERAGNVSSKLDGQGRFVIRGLPAGPVAVGFLLLGDKESGKMPPGYVLSLKNRCLDLERPHLLVGQLDHDISDLTILVEPAKNRKSAFELNLEPTAAAEYYEAHYGPITGVPPKDFAKVR